MVKEIELNLNDNDVSLVAMTRSRTLNLVNGMTMTLDLNGRDLLIEYNGKIFWTNGKILLCNDDVDNNTIIEVKKRIEEYVKSEIYKLIVNG